MPERCDHHATLRCRLSVDNLQTVHRLLPRQRGAIAVCRLRRLTDDGLGTLWPDEGKRAAQSTVFMVPTECGAEAPPGVSSRHEFEYRVHVDEHEGAQLTEHHSIADARRNLPSLVRDAENGETVEITRKGEPVAVLVSHREFERLASGRRGFGEAYEEFANAVGLSELALDPDELFGGVRQVGLKSTANVGDAT